MFNTFDVRDHNDGGSEDMKKMVADLDSIVGETIVTEPLRDIAPIIDSAVRSYMALNWPDYIVDAVFLMPDSAVTPHFMIRIHHKNDKPALATTVTFEPVDRAAFDTFVEEMVAWMTEHQNGEYWEPVSVEDEPEEPAYQTPDDILYERLK